MAFDEWRYPTSCPFTEEWLPEAGFGDVVLAVACLFVDGPEGDDRAALPAMNPRAAIAPPVAR
jgi:hypothetical protein